MASTTDLNQAADKVRSRRALLAGAVGGLGAWLVSAAQRAMPAEAAAGDPMRIGQVNHAGGTNTTLEARSAGHAFVVEQNGGGAAIRGTSTKGHGAIFETLDDGFGKHAVIARSAGGGAAIYADGGGHAAIEARSSHDPAISAHGGHLGAISCGSVNGYGIRAVSQTRAAVHGMSQSDSGVVGISGTGDGVVGRGRRWAGRFDGAVLVQGPCTFESRTARPAPPADQAQLFLRGNSSGKGELCVQFPTGAVIVVATEP